MSLFYLSMITSLNVRKAPGYDLISGKVLQELPPKAIVLLTTLYNSMLRLSYYPLIWKFAQIIMVPKPGKPAHDVTSYRPISLLPIPSKVFERLLLKRLRSDETYPSSFLITSSVFAPATPLSSKLIGLSTK